METTSAERRNARNKLAQKHFAWAEIKETSCSRSLSLLHSLRPGAVSCSDRDCALALLRSCWLRMVQNGTTAAKISSCLPCKRQCRHFMITRELIATSKGILCSWSLQVPARASPDSSQNFRPSSGNVLKAPKTSNTTRNHWLFC